MAALQQKEGPLDYGHAIHKIFHEADADSEALRLQIWPALVALSELGLDKIPNLMCFLHAPESPAFPEPALGLQLLLDRAPWALCHGVNTRYTHGYFGEIAYAYVKQLQALPQGLRPYSWARWKEEEAVSVDYFVLVRLWFGGPFVHHEGAADDAVAFTEETRVFVEFFFQVRDPYRHQPNK